MYKRIPLAVTLALLAPRAALADYSSNGIEVSTTPHTAVAATQTVGLDCSANRPVAKLIWHVDSIGWSGGDNVTSLRFSGREVLAALGGGAMQHVTARCSALDANGVELANQETILTVYDPSHPDAFEPGTQAPAYFVPKAMLAVMEKPVWEQGDPNSANSVGIIDTVPLRADEPWRRPSYLTAAVIGGDPARPNALGYVEDQNGELYHRFCRSSLQPEPFPCGHFVGGTSARTNGFYFQGNSAIEYAGRYLIGFKVSRSTPLDIGYRSTDNVQLHHTVASIIDSAPGEAYNVGSTEWGLLETRLGTNDYTIPEDHFFAGPYFNDDQLIPYLFDINESIGFNWDNHRPATRFAANTDITLPVLELLKRVISSNVNGRWMTLDEAKSNYTLLALYQIQGDTTISAWATSRRSDGTIYLRANNTGRAVVFVATESTSGDIERSLFTLIFD